MFNKLLADPNIRCVLFVPPLPYVAAAARENDEFQHAMLSLAACGHYDSELITEGFKKFAASRPWPWRDSVTYCRAHHLEHGRFPSHLESTTAMKCIFCKARNAETDSAACVVCYEDRVNRICLELERIYEENARPNEID